MAKRTNTIEEFVKQVSRKVDGLDFMGRPVHVVDKTTMVDGQMKYVYGVVITGTGRAEAITNSNTLVYWNDEQGQKS
jgi:hypothetical protein